MVENNYEILKIHDGATEKEIRKAYRNLVLKFHTDRGGDDEQFKKIKQAYEDLKIGKKYPDTIDERRKNNLYCDVLFIRLTNIKEINNDYGREVGNLFISEYVKKMKESFVSNNGDVFRMGGTSFIITLTDPNKSSIIDNSIKSGKPFLDVQMNYGNISSVLKVSGVIKNSKIFGNIKTDLTSLKNKLKSLRTFEDKRPVIRDND